MGPRRDRRNWACKANIALATWCDAQVHSAYPATPFGADESALAGDAAGVTAPVLLACTDMYAYLSGPVQSAHLYLYTYGAQVASPWLSVGVARVTAAWQEDTVTWATCPALGAASFNNGAGDQIDTTLTIKESAVAAYRPYLHVFVPEPAAACFVAVLFLIRAAQRRSSTSLGELA
jgi:hypothetical protein